MSTNMETAKRYLAALEEMGECAKLADFFTADVIQQEFPNKLTPNGAQRDLAALLDGCERGKLVLSAQSYAIKNSVESGNTVVLEVLWTGTLAIAIGDLPVGGQMQAHFAVFLEFEAGKIAAQRNYDCFLPF